ncbi:MAG: glycerophosphodiester phosphodiesterase [Pyrodictiaceae archaeon]
MTYEKMNAVLERLSRRPFAVIGHRGARGEAPENTLKALHQAIRSGADIAEFDLHATKDKHVIVHHDPVIHANGGGRIVIKEATFSSIRKITVSGEPIPSLEEVLAEARDKIPLFLEVKDPADTELIITTIKKENASDWVAIISFYDQVLRDAKRINRNIATGLIYYQPPGKILEAKKIGAEIVLPRYNVASEKAIGFAHRLNLKVVVWTLNDEKRIRIYYRRGVDGIATDYPSRVVRIRDQIAMEDKG